MTASSRQDRGGIVAKWSEEGERWKKDGIKKEER